MKKVTVNAYGKVNLTLNVLGKENNLHLIDSVMVSVNLCDVVHVCERLDNKLSIEFIGKDSNKIDKTKNTALRAAQLLRSRFGDFGADVIIEKNLPLAGGMGGSSADAAGVFNAFDMLYDFSKRGFNMLQESAKIGSDVPFMLKGGWARVGGTGNIVNPIIMDNPPKLNMVAAFPLTGCDTGMVYKKFDTLNLNGRVCDNDAFILGLQRGEVFTTANALTDAAACFCTDILRYKKLMLALNAKDAFMTGSGSSVIGLFDSRLAALNALEQLKKQDVDSCLI